MNPLDPLKEHLRRFTGGGIAVAFSGGVDSALLLSVLAELRSESPFALLALTMQSPFQEQTAAAEAERLARSMGIAWQSLSHNPLAIPSLEYNPPDRCYLCKRSIFRAFRQAAVHAGLATLMDGTNADDLGVYRPGRRALNELGVISPLAQCGLTKETIRRLSAVRGLPTAQRPAMPCLATRFDYGAHLTGEALRRVEKGEALLRAMLPPQTVLRLRVHNDLARIEVPPSCFPHLIANREQISAAMQRLGFRFITMDLAGYRSGCYDTALSSGAEKHPVPSQPHQ